MKEIAPYMISERAIETKEESVDTYLTFDPSALDFMLINAIKEQQEMIEAQQKQIKVLHDQLQQLAESLSERTSTK